ncbi:MAG: urease accessory protein UreD, partial [Pseudomonadota bacterium]
MSLPATSYQPQTLPRAIGEGKLSVGADGAVTRVAELRHSGCLKVLMPRTFRADAEAVLVNTAGGITGGDRFDIAAEVGTGAALTLTSQAAERIYRSSDGTRARVETRLRVADGARLQWLPQET